MNPRPMLRHAMTILWPAFLMAGVLDAIVFSVVDPLSLRGWGGAPIDWPEQAVYTAAFFVFWAAIVAAGVMTRLLEGSPEDINRDGFSAAFRR